MSLRSRLLFGAALIVAVSLALSGTVTWLLVQQATLRSARDELGRVVLQDRARVQQMECSTTPCRNPAVLADRTVFQESLRAMSGSVGGDRLLLLNAKRVVIFDSQDGAGIGQPVETGRPRQAGSEPATDINLRLAGIDYVAAAATLAAARDPLRAAWVVRARGLSGIVGSTGANLVPKLVGVAIVSLLFSLLIALLLSRTLTRPLTELAHASEDIAAGNYSRRARLAGGREIQIVGTAFNRMAEAVERARRLQRDFLANVSHELKTPLTSLIGFSQAMLDGSAQSAEEKTRAATIINEEAHRVLRMAQELLDLARVESGEISMHIQPVDLEAMLVQEIDFVRRRADDRGLELRLQTRTGLAPVRADPERLHQILNNLLDNAVKYAPDGSRVEVGAQMVGGAVEVAIANPVGPTAPELERMFERFYRGDPSRRSAAASGVGLGLAISRELAEAQRGRLTAELDQEGRLVMRLTLERAPATSRSTIL